ncbi:MAG TPA: hypothetical protein VGB71_18700, partial [Flavisolibacter sp.]
MLPETTVRFRYKNCSLANVEIQANLSNVRSKATDSSLGGMECFTAYIAIDKRACRPILRLACRLACLYACPILLAYEDFTWPSKSLPVMVRRVVMLLP